MTDFLNIPVLPVFVTLAGFWVGTLCQKKWKSPLLNPILIGMALVVVFLLSTGMDTAVYKAGTDKLSWLMTPATIALAIPMYEQFQLLKRNLPKTAFGHIMDPEVAKQAAEAGIGATISCVLGAKTDKLHGEPIVIEKAYVKAICDGKFINHSPMGFGETINHGLTVRLQVGNVDIVVTSLPRQTMDKGPFEIVGINYSEYQILCLKSSQHFRAFWTDRAAKIAQLRKC